jgi:hypothetical protein
VSWLSCVVSRTKSELARQTGGVTRDALKLCSRRESSASTGRRRVMESLRLVRSGRLASTSNRRSATGASERKDTQVKYMILTFASQQGYQEMVGQPSERPAWTQEDYAALGGFMQTFNQELLDSGELIETRGLSFPVHSRRVSLQEGVAVVTDGPYAEAEEVLAGYWIVDCDSFDRATEIASRLVSCPGPEHVRARAYADVRPIDEHQPGYEG